jgi:hypothetical protein
MSTPGKLPWYQFSLRSLLFFTVFVALLCSIGVSTGRGFAAAVVVNVLISGFAGRTVAGTWWGMVLGFVSGSLCAGVSALTCAYFWSGRFAIAMPLLGLPSWEHKLAVYAVATIASLVGGALGGYAVRPHSER